VTNKRESPTSAGMTAQPRFHQRAAELQAYGTVNHLLPIELEESVRLEITAQLNQLLADTMTLRDLYKKSHWQVTGPTFYQLHLLFDKHFDEQVDLVDSIAERIQLLGGVSIAMAHDVAGVPQSQDHREWLGSCAVVPYAFRIRMGCDDVLCAQSDQRLDADGVENLLQSGYRHSLVFRLFVPTDDLSLAAARRIQRPSQQGREEKNITKPADPDAAWSQLFPFS
jgi:hypothetical protein